MTVTVASFKVEPQCNCRGSLFRLGKEHVKKNHRPSTYWGIYVNGKRVTFKSSKELAERTKLFIEKWIEKKL